MGTGGFRHVPTSHSLVSALPFSARQLQRAIDLVLVMKIGNDNLDLQCTWKGIDNKMLILSVKTKCQKH